MRRPVPFAASIALAARLVPALLLPIVGSAEVVRNDVLLDAGEQCQLWLREVVDRERVQGGPPLLLLHGARVPGAASFDLPVSGGSLAADLAGRGIHVFIGDLYGYGLSSRPAAMNRPPDASEPLVRSGEAVQSLAVMVDEVRRRTGAPSVGLLGWATGGHWAGQYAATYPDAVSHLVFLNSLYGYSDGHDRLGAGSALEDPAHPGRFNVAGFHNYRYNTADSLVGSWDGSIPLDDKSAWRDPKVLAAYQAAALASDPSAGDRDPPSFRAPSGALADSYLLATGAALWDARLTRADALVVRSGNDFWSRPEDVTMLRRHVSAAGGQVVVLELEDATHYVHLDRAERGRRRLLNAVVEFLR